MIIKIEHNKDGYEFNKDENTKYTLSEKNFIKCLFHQMYLKLCQANKFIGIKK